MNMSVEHIFSDSSLNENVSRNHFLLTVNLVNMSAEQMCEHVSRTHFNDSSLNENVSRNHFY